MSKLFNQSIPNEDTLELYKLLNEMFTPEEAARYRYLSAVTEYSSLHKDFLKALESKNPSINASPLLKERYSVLRAHAAKHFFKPSPIHPNRKVPKALEDLDVSGLLSGNLLMEAKKNISKLEKNNFADTYLDRANPPPALEDASAKVAFKEYFSKISRLNELSGGKLWGHSFRRYAADPADFSQERIARMQAALDAMDKEDAEKAARQTLVSVLDNVSGKAEKSKSLSPSRTAKSPKLFGAMPSKATSSKMSSGSLGGMTTSTLASEIVMRVANQSVSQLSNSSFLGVGGSVRYIYRYSGRSARSRNESEAHKFGRVWSANEQNTVRRNAAGGISSEVIRSSFAGNSGDKKYDRKAPGSSYKISGFISGANWVNGGWGQAFLGEASEKIL